METWLPTLPERVLVPLADISGTGSRFVKKFLACRWERVPLTTDDAKCDLRRAV